MRRVTGSALTIAAVVLTVTTSGAQAPMEQSGKVAGGGIFAPGWMGKIDANEVKAGMVLNNSKLAAEGANFRVTTGPAVTYWNPANKATGDYTVKATFTEPKYMNLNDHPHPYGIMIAGNDLDTDNASLLYCTAYGNGTFIMRGFGPAPFSLRKSGLPDSIPTPRRPEANAAIGKAAGKDAPVTQTIAVSVKGDKIECNINGTVVGTYDKSGAVGAGKLKSTDGVYGIRFAHNTEATVTGLTMTKP